MLSAKVFTERVEKWLSSVYWTQCNIRSALYGETLPPRVLQVYEPDHLSRPAAGDIIARPELFIQTAIGTSFGPSWATKWFRLVFEVPPSMAGRDIALRWNSSSEAMLYDAHGRALQGFTGGEGANCRDLFIISKSDSAVGKLEYFVEMACNDLFGNGNNGMIFPPSADKHYCLSQAELVVVHSCTHALYWDVKVMHDYITEKTPADPSAALALGLLTQVINTTDLTNQDSIVESHTHLKNSFFCSPSEGKVDHDVCALGHCHIDTAWLWPYAETRRKIVRSWSTQLRLMADYPYKFVASQTVHYEWLKEDNPELYGRVASSVREGRFLPVGGSYVEFDANMPSGESMVRQLLYGMQFFETEFGIRPRVFWLPDTFGYSGQLPQLLQGFDIPYFLSQKLSWNLYNKFPHTSFVWEGIDGSSVVSHFPSADTYGAECTVAEVTKSVTNNKSMMASNRSLLLFGIGDGGGGPHMSHLAQLHRLKLCKGLPRIHADTTPADFFDKIKKDFYCRGAGYPPPPRWVGELYLELHQGSLTSQARIKMQNRQCESRLRGVEALCVYCWRLSFLVQLDEPSRARLQGMTAEITALWKDVLLNQFHDVLPGTSIAAVYEDSNRMLTNVLIRCRHLSDFMVSLLMRHASHSTSCGASSKRARVELQSVRFNPCGVAHEDTPGFGFSLPGSPSPEADESKEEEHEERRHSILYQICASDTKSANARRVYALDNGIFEVDFSASGEIVSLIDLRASPPRQVVQAGEAGGKVMLYDDIPFYWDAWDVMPYHAMTGRQLNGPGDVQMIAHELDTSALPHEIKVKYNYNNFRSHAKPKGMDGDCLYKIAYEMTYVVRAGDPLIECLLHCDWHESHKLLKVEFPLNVRATKVKYDIQYGFVERPTHRNQDTDAAMFEGCGHKYADCSEDGYGVAVLNDCKYGYSARDSTLCLSLLRSPKSPDPQCDMGRHHIRFALLPHLNGSCGSDGLSDVVHAATLFNSPEQEFALNSHPQQHHVVPWCITDQPLFRVHDWDTSRRCPLILDAMKPSEQFMSALAQGRERPGDEMTILRFYESVGSTGRACVSCGCGQRLAEVYECNMKEEKRSARSIKTGRDRDVFWLDYRPFQVITVAVRFDGAKS